ncbi:MAG: hypothetical protein HYY29_01070, partial [Chloroflexi bacterium]|nr:hypothetical protein [Chloroflexota bacterium]
MGILKKDTLVFQSESEMSVLMDYCIYDYRWDGSNVIEKYLGSTTWEPGSDERILLEAMRQARYSVFAVEKVEKGVGVLTHDLLRGDSGFIMDVALSETATDDIALACRIISPGGGTFSMGTGAGIPASGDILMRIAKRMEEKIPTFGKTVREITRLSADRA